MIKDIIIEKVEDVAIAVVPEEKDGGKEWSAYLVNLKPDAIDGVLISSKGYGNLEGRNVKTTTFRHFWEKISGRDFVKIELIVENLLAINNEFWVSFWHHGTLYDKRYIFVTESITEENLTEIPLIGMKGVMIK